MERTFDVVEKENQERKEGADFVAVAKPGKDVLCSACDGAAQPENATVAHQSLALKSRKKTGRMTMNNRTCQVNKN